MKQAETQTLYEMVKLKLPASLVQLFRKLDFLKKQTRTPESKTKKPSMYWEVTNIISDIGFQTR